jgi:4-amino-4-deoxy-L-arabinose transferase-like glycosyltransferase
MVEEKTERKEVERRKERVIKRVGAWLRDPYFATFLLIMIIAIAIRIFWFFVFKNQALWFDEAEYMVKSKMTAFNFNWDVGWSARKPVLLAWIFVPFYKIGFNEAALKFILVLFSIAAVWLTYYTIKEFFDKKIALIATSLMAVFWVNLFFSIRFLVDMPSTTLFLASLYFFVKGYVKKENPRYIWLFGVFFALGFLMRVSYGIFLFPFALYILFEEKLSFLKNKHLWIAAFVTFLVVLPYFIWLFHIYPEDPLGQFIGAKYGRFSIGKEHGSMGFPGIWEYLKEVPKALNLPFFILFLWGAIIVLTDLILGIDLLFKKDYSSLRLKFFILLWIIMTIVVMGLTRSYVEDRDFIICSFFMFSLVGIALTQIYGFILKKFSYKYLKPIVTILLIALIVYGGWLQVTQGYASTKYSSTSYLPVKQAGLWIKEHSSQNDAVTTKSLPQIQYYAERPTYDVFFQTEEAFVKGMVEKNIRFFVPSTFEPYWLVPQWSYTWGQDHPEIATPAWWWTDNPEKPTQFILIYEINQSALKEYLASLNKTVESTPK